MTRLSEMIPAIRSKNAGPFWLTVDLFCGSGEKFEAVSFALDTVRVAQALGVAPEVVLRFDIPELSVIKFSIPRPATQGTTPDRDMHGASFALVVGEIEL